MRRLGAVLTGVVLAGVALLMSAAPASAHVVPSTSIALDVHEGDITANLVLPATDLQTASGIAIGDDLDSSTAAEVAAYLEDHFSAATGDDQWTVTVDDIDTSTTEQWGTGEFDAVTATATLVPDDAADLRTFTLDYDAIVHQVVTADIFVTLHSDWSTGALESARDLGAITVNTATGAIPTLTVDLDDGSA